MPNRINRETMDREWIEIRIRSIIKEVADTVLTEDDMDMDLIASAGFDSLTLMEILAQMEERFSIEVDLNALENTGKITPRMFADLAANTLSDDQLNEPFFIRNIVPESGAEQVLTGDDELDAVVAEYIARADSDLFEMFRDVSNFRYVLLPEEYLEPDFPVTVGQIAKNHLMKHEGTCISSSCAMHVVLRRLGYDAKLYYGMVHGRTRDMSVHMWNEISVNGERYIFDTTMYMGLRLAGYFGLRPDSALYQYEMLYDAAVPENIPAIKAHAKQYFHEIEEEYLRTLPAFTPG